MAYLLPGVPLPEGWEYYKEGLADTIRIPGTGPRGGGGPGGTPPGAPPMPGTPPGVPPMPPSPITAAMLQFGRGAMFGDGDVPSLHPPSLSEVNFGSLYSPEHSQSRESKALIANVPDAETNAIDAKSRQTALFMTPPWNASRISGDSRSLDAANLISAGQSRAMRLEYLSPVFASVDVARLFGGGDGQSRGKPGGARPPFYDNPNLTGATLLDYDNPDEGIVITRIPEDKACRYVETWKLLNTLYAINLDSYEILREGTDTQTGRTYIEIAVTGWVVVIEYWEVESKLKCNENGNESSTSMGTTTVTVIKRQHVTFEKFKFANLSDFSDHVYDRDKSRAAGETAEKVLKLFYSYLNEEEDTLAGNPPIVKNEFVILRGLGTIFEVGLKLDRVVREEEAAAKKKKDESGK